jgi:hypothetical protein
LKTESNESSSSKQDWCQCKFIYYKLAWIYC